MEPKGAEQASQRLALVRGMPTQGVMNDVVDAGLLNICGRAGSGRLPQLPRKGAKAKKGREDPARPAPSL